MLSDYNERRAIEFFRDLLWAEAQRLGIPFNHVNVSARVTVADGGVDASVNGATGATGLIKDGLTCYQIKTGTTFSPWQPAMIRKELFGDHEEAKDNLGSAVRNCLERDGTYVLVCFG